MRLRRVYAVGILLVTPYLLLVFVYVNFGGTGVYLCRADEASPQYRVAREMYQDVLNNEMAASSSHKPAAIEMAASNSQKPAAREMVVSNSHKPAAREIVVSNRHKPAAREIVVSNRHKPAAREMVVSNRHKPAAREMVVSNRHKPAAIEMAVSNSHKPAAAKAVQGSGHFETAVNISQKPAAAEMAVNTSQKTAPAEMAVNTSQKPAAVEMAVNTRQKTAPAEMAVNISQKPAAAEMAVNTRQKTAPAEMAVNTSQKPAAVETAVNTRQKTAAVETVVNTSQKTAAVETAVNTSQKTAAAEEVQEVIPHKFRPQWWKNHTQTMCRILGMNTNQSRIPIDQLNKVLVDDKHKLLFCQIAKVASTNLGKIFAILTGLFNGTNPNLIHPPDIHGKYNTLHRHLDSLSLQEVLHRINNYFKFVFVRDPFERLLSAYRNKFVKPPSSSFEYLSRKLVKVYRTNSTQRGGVTFEEFIKYLVDPTRVVPTNSHWQPFTELCRPCEMKYDFVGKLSSFNEDTRYILETNNLQNLVEFPRMPDSSHTMHKTDTLLRSYYSAIPKELLRKLYNTYYSDYVLFDFTVPPVIKELML